VAITRSRFNLEIQPAYRLSDQLVNMFHNLSDQGYIEILDKK
jgi:hypothetical protein